jgi:hypothetical protein
MTRIVLAAISRPAFTWTPLDALVDEMADRMMAFHDQRHDGKTINALANARQEERPPCHLNSTVTHVLIAVAGTESSSSQSTPIARSSWSETSTERSTGSV